MIKKSVHKIKQHFPNSRMLWRVYLKKTLPIIIAELIFALGAFVDNFMVTHIPNGVNSLSYANTWTGILTTVFVTINSIAAMLVGQFYGSKQYSKLNQIMALRIWTYVSIATIFAIFAWSMPYQMISFIGPGDTDALQGGVDYIRFMAIAWILLAIAWNTNGLLNETGHSLYAFFTACFNLIINITINAILIYGFKMGVQAASYGTVTSVFISIFLDCTWMYLKKKEIWTNPKNLFYISKKVAKMFFKRFFAFCLAISGMIVIPLRMIIWNRAYPVGSVGEKWMQIPASSVLALTESIATVFSASTAACGANVSVFVASNLGKDNFEEAEKHSKSLKGFHTILGLVFSLGLIIFALAMYESQILAGGIRKEIINNLSTKDLAYLQNLTNIGDVATLDKNQIIQLASKMTVKINMRYLLTTLLTVALFNPLWSWFYTTSALISSGGRSTTSGLTTLVAQWSQFIFLIIIGLVIVPKYHWILPLSYFIFYSWDIVRLAIYEIVQHKIDWRKNINKELTTETNLPTNL